MPRNASSESSGANTVDPCTSAFVPVAGAVVGAVLGAVIAKHVTKKAHAGAIGAVLGGSLGAAIGRDVARRQCELQKIARKYQLEVITEQLRVPAAQGGDHAPGVQPAPNQAAAEAPAVGLTANIVDGAGDLAQFQPGSDQLTARARQYFTELAAQYGPGARGDAAKDGGLKSSRLLVVGHTDDQEDSAHAARLSEQRARAVATLLRQAGVPEETIWYQGAGETLPIADNHTEAGRARNRRVEITDFASQEVMTVYLESRGARPEYFRPASSEPEASSDAGPASSPVAAPQARQKSRAKRIPRPSSSAHASRDGVADAGEPESVPGRSHAVPAERAPAPAAAQPRVAHHDVQSKRVVDFGGEPYSQERYRVRIGEPPRRLFGFMSEAHASEVAALSSCVEDRPHVSRAVKSLRDGAEYQFRDYLPGMYGNSWVGMVNGHLVALNGVAVLKDGGTPAREPTLLVYRDFKADGRHRAADYKGKGQVNTYLGSEGTLYRVFLEASAPVKCIDVVLPREAPFTARSGNLFQERAGGVRAAAFQPRVP